MKSASILTVCTLAFAAPLMPAADRVPDPSVAITTQRIELAPADTDERGLEKYIGASVTGAKGEVLGELRDFLVDERTSRLGFAVVASGGMLGFGDTLRLLPTGALKWSHEDARFSVGLTGEQWRELLTISETDFEEHRLAISGRDPRRREPGESGTTATSTPGSAGSATLDQRLMRISTLPGTDVHVLDRDVGEIEDVILDFRTGTVRALLDPDREFAGSGDKVLVPLGKFVFAERGERLVSTTLTRGDFNDLYASWNQTTGPREPAWVADRHREQRGLPPLTDQNPVDPKVLLPTGRDTSSVSDAVSRIRDAAGEPNSHTQLGAPDVRLAAQGGEQSLRDFLNRPVFGIAGAIIGTVEDFLVDRTSGRLAHAVVSVPEAPLHERRRLLRADTLRWQPGSGSFEVEAAAELPADDSTRLQVDTFLSARSLMGQSVRNGNWVVGRITDVVIDFRTRSAAPVLSPSPTVMKTQRTFVVSLSRMRICAGDSNATTTTVTPEELARAEVAATPIAVNGSLPMSPITGASGIAQSSVTGQTGYSSAQTAAAGTTEATDGGVIDEPLPRTARGRPEPHDAEALSRAAHNVRQMLQEIKSTAGATVEVSMEKGKLVLHGSVPSTTAKNQLEQRAASAAPGVPLESRLTVRAGGR